MVEGQGSGSQSAAYQGPLIYQTRLSTLWCLNWLAHLYLSEPTPEFRLGNLLPDLMRPAELQGFSAEVLRGAQCHRRIDVFTDSHPAVRRSVARLPSPYRRYGGILVDVFYDHFLAANWPQYSATPFEEFTRETYAGFPPFYLLLPAEVTGLLQRMQADDYLGSYRTVPGIQLTLSRISNRLRRPLNLGESVIHFQAAYEDFHRDFAEFFPQLCQHVASVGGEARHS